MNIGVFCASSEKIEPIYREAARMLGEGIGNRGWNLVYGGTNCGLMNIVAKATQNSGGKTKGIIPRCIVERGIAANEADELIVTSDMKERKQALRDFSDAFIALPGGWGTLEEITEVITLKQLGQHNKPVIFLNTNGFYRTFFRFIQEIQVEGFISGRYERIYQAVGTVEEAFRYIENYRPVLFSSKYTEGNKKNLEK